MTAASRSRLPAGTLLALLVVVLVTARLVLHGVDAPFDLSYHGENGGVYSLVARNYDRYGFGHLLGAMCLEPGAPVDQPRVYTAHPAVTGWSVWLSQAVFGEGPWQTRLPQVGWSVLAACLAFALLRELFHTAARPRRDLLAAAGALCMVGTPVVAHYGNMTDPQGTAVIAPVLGTLLAMARRWRTGETRGIPWRAMAWLAVAGSLDWPAHFAGGVLAALSWRRGDRKAAGMLFATCVVVGVAWIAYGVLVARVHTNAADILASLGNRSGAAGLRDDQGQPFGLAAFARRLVAFHGSGAFLPTFGLGLVGAWLATRAAWRAPRVGPESRPPLELLLVLPAAGLLHVMLFPQGAYVHEYWVVYWLAGLALAAVPALVLGVADRPRVTAWAAAVLALVAVVWTDVDTRARWAARAPELHRMVAAGRTVAAAAPADRVVASLDWVPASLQWHADRKILRVPDDIEAAALLQGWAPLQPLVAAMILPTDRRAALQPFFDAVGFSGPQGLGFRGLELWRAPRPTDAAPAGSGDGR